ncbi:MAG: membrane protein insertase YidC [Acidobacteriaceae bacterium]|nr:membrane protein insertase YidC [Acidobacteriaceae bacterium]MBV8571112.1 membrane protein insertase YidC [Acidobacteriaceae bacterium]
MSNSPGSNLPGAAPPSLEKRLPLALALMMLVLLVSQYIFKPAPGPKPVRPVNDQHAAVLAEKPAAQTAALPAESPVASGQIEAVSLVSSEVDTDLYHIVLSNRGGVITSWVLKRYKNDAGKPLQLINLSATGVPQPFSLQVTGRQLSFDPNTVLYRPTVTDGGLSITYEYANSGTSIRKSFVFQRDSYLSTIKTQVLENNTPVPSMVTWRGGFGDEAVRNASALQHTVRFDTTANKLITKTTKDAKNGPVTDTGNYAFAGLEDNFFAAVALPVDSSSLEVGTYSDEVKLPNADKPAPFVGVGLATGAQNDFSLFVGPKDIQILKKVNPKLAQIIDWGFFGVIAKPLFLWLNWTKDHWTGNYGWAIIVVTLLINLALFPLRLTSLKSARKMQKLQPQIQAINAKYKNISMRDPKKAEQNQEVMELYKREGVNPVGGCLPMIIQLPFFYAFYRVLNIAIELRHAPWLWVPDLSSPEALPIHLLPIILIATQFFSQRLTPAAGVDPNQQKMMMFMPLLFGFMFYYASAGLVLYWLTGNLVGIAQQLIINRFMPAPAPPPKPPAKAPVKRTVKK